MSKKKLNPTQLIERYLKKMYGPLHIGLGCKEAEDKLWTAEPVLLPSNDDAQILLNNFRTVSLFLRGFKFAVKVWAPIHVIDNRGYYFIEWKQIHETKSQENT